MDRELEMAGAASLGGWLRRRKQARHTLPAGTPCPNCSTPLAGPYCHDCGQLGEQFNRSLLHLVGEAVENFFHVDGRLFHTLPRLALRPAELTTDYMEGRRASQIPPLRLFLVVMLIFFFVGGLHGHNDVRVAGPEALKELKADPDAARAMKRVEQAQVQAQASQGQSALGAWLEPRVRYAAAHPHEFTLIFESWTHRIAIAMLPVAAAILSLLFVFRRRFYVYDHLIFSMHSLSFMGLLGSVQSLMSAFPGLGGPSALLLTLAPIHLFGHMRGVYGAGVFGTLWRMFVLFVLSMIALGLMLLAVLVVGLSEMRIGAEGAGKPGAAVAYTRTLS